MFPRRRLLNGAARIATPASDEMLLPPNVLRALAQAPSTQGSLRGIKQIAMLIPIPDFARGFDPSPDSIFNLFEYCVMRECLSA